CASLLVSDKPADAVAVRDLPVDIAPLTLLERVVNRAALPQLGEPLCEHSWLGSAKQRESSAADVHGVLITGCIRGEEGNCARQLPVGDSVGWAVCALELSVVEQRQLTAEHFLVEGKGFFGVAWKEQVRHES